jgi:NAD(P)-dependent dehydrogenase (short-subunit alcohol dehydrogenase family)
MQLITASFVLTNLNDKLQMKRHANKNALVTGGTSGIGLATAKELLTQGASVVITGRDTRTVESIAREVGAVGIVSDQSSLSDMDALVKETTRRFSTLDILVLNAGIYSIVPFGEITESNFDAVMDINLKGVFFTLQKFIPILNKGASVIVVSSVAAYSTPGPGHAVYSATKAAVNALVRSVSYEVASKGIRVNAVCPGPTATPVFAKVGVPEEMATMIQNRIPLKRFGASADIARLISFMSSEDGSFITGSEYVIDGGLLNVPIMA